MPTQQSVSSHTSRDPVFLLVMLTLVANFLVALYLTIHDWPAHLRSHLWGIIVAFALVVLGSLTRRYSLRQQDRIIRLEERLRLAALLSPAQLAATHALTTPQLIALRFASDAELPALAQRAVAESLTPAQIKQAIVDWRPDHQRI